MKRNVVALVVLCYAVVSCSAEISVGTDGQPRAGSVFVSGLRFDSANVDNETGYHYGRRYAVNMPHTVI